MRIVVTGSAGRLGRVLVPRLLASGLADEVTGIDRAPAAYADTRYRHHRLDVRDPRSAALLEGADALAHLAFVLMGGGLGRRRHDREVVRGINVEGSCRVFEAAARAGVRQLVFVSSAAVYGAWPDNPPRLTETAPLRAMPGFAYAEDKIAVERWLDDFSSAHPDLTVTRLRPHAIVGAQAHPLLNLVLKQPLYPAARPVPLTQCIWEQDVARAMILALRQRTPGIFNLAADPPMSLRDMLGLVRRWRLPVTPSLLAATHRLAWRLTPAAGEPGWVQGLRHPLVLDTRQAQRTLRFTPLLDVAECVRRAARGWPDDA
ncbi:NAD-dependent epimerase/dehydratase family protein [Acidihalobacter prosperus]|uniref:NAD-dependent epimerase/dehydratase n=1 Tax=Acidihalobacter prosperus TaxID=160660 RepID=A0A1A6C3I6_9GAMM|nr:NAD-dependent epimerase/dehydratase family protein [Acidihalobacter prosperus]OBS09105.1 NAD-dependent epimerase/dehydratase [Acidihalobacter prosperus]